MNELANNFLFKLLYVKLTLTLPPAPGSSLHSVSRALSGKYTLLSQFVNNKKIYMNDIIHSSFLSFALSECIRMRSLHGKLYG